MTIKLTGKAGIWQVVGQPHIWVFKHSGTTWSARLGTHPYTEWRAIDKSQRNEKAPLGDWLWIDGVHTPPYLQLGRTCRTLQAVKLELAKVLKV